MQKNNWQSAGFFALLNQLTQLVFNLGVIMILLRILSKENCSVWIIFLTITTFIEVGRSGLMQNTLMTFLNTTPKAEHAKINLASLVINLALTFLIMLALWFSAPSIGQFFHDPDLEGLLKIYVATSLSLAFLFQFNFIQQANSDFKGLFVSSFFKSGGLFFYVLYCLFTNTSIELQNLAICQFISTIPAALAAFSFARPYFDIKAALSSEWVLKLLNYGKFTFGTNIATASYKNIDKFLLGRWLKESVSTYDLSVRINTLIEIPALTLASIMFPQSAQRSKNGDGTSSAKYLYEKSVGVLLSIILPIVVGVLCFSELIIWVIGSSKYSESAILLRLTVFYGVFMSFAIQFGTILDSNGKPKLNFLVTTFGALLNLTLNYFFISHYGIYGAAYGSLLAMLLMFVVMQSILYKIYNVQFWRVFIYMKAFYSQIFSKIKEVYTLRFTANKGV
jgi:lipopolysaccharide exporter